MARAVEPEADERWRVSAEPVCVRQHGTARRTASEVCLRVPPWLLVSDSAGTRTRAAKVIADNFSTMTLLDSSSAATAAANALCGRMSWSVEPVRSR